MIPVEKLTEQARQALSRSQELLLKLRHNALDSEHVLLIPEGAVRLNPTAAEVLELCDGERSLDDIVGAVSARYEGADVRADVLELVDAMAQKGLVVDAA